MMAVEPTIATGSGDSPARNAGRMNFVSASIVTPMPTSAKRPRQRATRTTSTEKIAASAVRGNPRWKSRNSYDTDSPAGWMRMILTSSPASMPAV